MNRSSSLCGNTKCPMCARSKLCLDCGICDGCGYDEEFDRPDPLVQRFDALKEAADAPADEE